MRFSFRAIGYVALAGLILCCAHAQAGSQLANELTQLLTTDASAVEKDKAIRELTVIADAQAVPALAALLGDEALSALASTALEVMPEPSAAEALREALGRLEGNARINVIHALGNRRDAEAVKSLGEILASPNADEAAAAAVALARIGGKPAAALLVKTLAAAPEARRTALGDACLLCAEGFVKAGEPSKAIALYERLDEPGMPEAIVRSAKLGLVTLDEEKYLPMVAEALAGDDWGQIAFALQVARRIERPAMTQELIGALKGAPAEKQVLILKALGDRSDAAAILPVALDLAKAGDPAVRVEAINVIGRQGDVAAVAPLFALAGDPQAEVAKAAVSVLAGLPGQDVDKAIVARLASQDAAVRLLALEMVGKRQFKAAASELMKASADPDAKVRQAALKALGEGGGREEMNLLLSRMMDPAAGADLASLEATVRAIGTRQNDPQWCTECLLAAMPQAAPDQRCALLRLAGPFGQSAGLAATRQAIKDPDAKVREAAFRTLCDWPTPEAASDLLALAKAAPEGPDRVLPLRGYIRLIREKSIRKQQKVTMCREAAALASDTEEKKRLLGVMQGIYTPQTLEMSAALLDNPATRDEAAAAAISICERFTSGKEPNAKESYGLVRQVMETVEKQTESADQKRRARAVLDKIASQG